jgi:hypothetical protein
VLAPDRGGRRLACGARCVWNHHQLWDAKKKVKDKENRNHHNLWTHTHEAACHTLPALTHRHHCDGMLRKKEKEKENKQHRMTNLCA